MSSCRFNCGGASVSAASYFGISGNPTRRECVLAFSGVQRIAISSRAAATTMTLTEAVHRPAIVVTAFAWIVVLALVGATIASRFIPTIIAPVFFSIFLASEIIPSVFTAIVVFVVIRGLIAVRASIFTWKRCSVVLSSTNANQCQHQQKKHGELNHLQHPLKNVRL